MAWTRYLACFSPRRDISYPQIRAKLGPWHLIGCEGSGYVKCYIFRYSRTHISLFILHKCQVIDAWHNWFSWTVESTRLITAEPSIYQHTCLKRNKTHHIIGIIVLRKCIQNINELNIKGLSSQQEPNFLYYFPKLSTFCSAIDLGPLFLRGD